jgi:hypothetical protein
VLWLLNEGEGHFVVLLLLMESISVVRAEQPSGREVRRPYWLISIPAADCRDEMEGLVFPTIDDDADDEAQQQTKLITYLAKLRELGTPHRGDVRDTRSTSFLHQTTPTEEKSALQPSGALFGSRCEPTHGAHVVAVFDLKPGREPFSQPDVAQVVTYCKHLLTVEQPGRSEATSFLLSAANVVFVRVVCSHNSSFTYEFTPAASVVPSGADTGVGASLPPIGVQWLYQFFSSSHNSHLGMEVVNNPFEKTFVHSTLLGRGTMGRVYSVIGHDDKVIKLVRYISKTNEAEVLRQLAQVNVPHVPRVLEAARSCTSLLLWPRATDLKPGQFGLRHALQALDTLQSTHEMTGLVHRDIQPANLLLLATHHHDHLDGHPDTQRDLGGQEDILVNDWGSAAPANQLRPYAGTFTYASDAVLRHIAEGKERFPVGPANDLVSLVRTTFTLLVSPHASDTGRTKCSLAVAARRLIDRWASALSQDGKWAELQAAAERCDYEAVRRGLQELSGP